MDGSRHGRFKGRDGAERAAQLGLRLRGVELGAAAGVQARGGEVQRLALVLDVPARDVELALLAAQLEVRTGHFRDDDDLRVVQLGFRGARSALRASMLRRMRPKKSSSHTASKPAS